MSKLESNKIYILQNNNLATVYKVGACWVLGRAVYTDPGIEITLHNSPLRVVSSADGVVEDE